MLDDDEAVALAVGLQAAAQAGVAGVAESSVSALAKVVQVMPPRLRRRVEALRAMTVSAGGPPSGSAGPVVDPAALTTVAQACRDAVRMRFAYTSAEGSRTDDREVEPARLVLLRRRWYLVAYDLGRQGWRSFRLDRLERPAMTAIRFRPRDLPGDDAAAFVQQGIHRMPDTYAIEVLVTAPAALVDRRIGAWAQVEPLDDTSCRVRMHADQFIWPAMGLAQLEAEFTVVDPPELRTYLTALAERFGRATRSDGLAAGSRRVRDQEVTP